MLLTSVTLLFFHFISFLILLIYISLILFYYFKFRNSNSIKIESIDSKKFVSVIIVGRNEASHIKSLINSIIANNYPDELFEIIYIDDFSTDDSINVLKNIDSNNLKIHELKEVDIPENLNNYKKTALKYAVSLTNGEIIIQTDADTVVGEDWIISHVSCYENEKINFVTGPVFFKSNNTAIELFQKYDFIATMGVTCASIDSKLHYMANGANMSFRKKVFNDFQGNEFASGDDMFLIQDVAYRYPNSVMFLKNNESKVYTYPESNISDFIRQRLRWATKTNSYKNSSLKFVIMITFLINFIVLVNLIMILFLGLGHLYFTVFLIITKLIVDFTFTSSVAKYFKEEVKGINLVMALLRYPIYIVSIGVISNFSKKYIWKEREVK